MKNWTLESKLEVGAGLLCAVALAFGLLADHTGATLLAGIGLGLLGQRWFKRFNLRRESLRDATPGPSTGRTASSAGQSTPARVAELTARPRRVKGPVKQRRGNVDDPSVFVDTMIADGRYALLLRPEVVPNLTTGQLQQAVAALHDDMAFVPNGDVTLGTADTNDNLGGSSHHVQSVFVDRYPITNEIYKQFVDDGGYENEEFWDDGVFSGVANFVDQTNCLGPRFWSHGTYGTGLGDHPVVGINWFEANACARWMGKRLPVGPEWVKAAAWPVTGPDGQIQQRKYPWGDRFGEGMANTWSSGVGGTVAVFDFDNGASMSGGRQFIGNVWEWMADDVRIAHHDAAAARTHRVKAVRGGAYDTYFESQTTCQFESGDDPFARKHNIGFRCVVSADDLATEVRQLRREQSGAGNTNEAIPVRNA